MPARKIIGTLALPLLLAACATNHTFTIDEGLEAARMYGEFAHATERCGYWDAALWRARLTQETGMYIHQDELLAAFDVGYTQPAPEMAALPCPVAYATGLEVLTGMPGQW